MKRLVPVAEYVRMSTEDQQYSIANQHDTNQAYAAAHGFVITARYEDAGKSGRTLRYRLGLQSLLRSVISGTAEFKAVLVYDVSRWGRFEDMDEAAHYEFLCSRAGIDVHYCAEPFINDGSFSSNFFKAMKRVMAGEYSRDLSYRMFSAKTRLSEKGFWMGANPGCGLRRCLIGEDGRSKGILKDGERKYLMSDRVVLVPGPPEEVACIREMFRMALTKSTRAITAELNARGLSFGRRWTLDLVKETLRNPKYTGTVIWGKTKVEPDGTRKAIPKQKWHWAMNALPPIVGRGLFNRVQRALDYRQTPTFSDEMLLQRFKKLIHKRGVLTTSTIDDEKSFRGRHSRRLNTITKIYEALGLELPPWVVASQKTGATQLRLAEVAESLKRSTPELTIVKEHRRIHLRLANGWVITLRACRSREDSCLERCWDVNFSGSCHSDMYLLCFYARDGQNFECYAIADGAFSDAGDRRRLLHLSDPLLRAVFAELSDLNGLIDKLAKSESSSKLSVSDRPRIA